MPAPVEPARVVVEGQLPHLEAIMVDAARKTAFRQQLRAYIEEAADDDNTALRHADVIEDVYGVQDFSPRFTDQFTDQWGLTPRGEEVLEVLEGASHRGIDPATLHVDDILELQYELYEAGEPKPVDGGFRPTASEVEVLVDLVASTDGGADEGAEAITEAVAVVDQRSEVPSELKRIHDYNRRESEHFSQRARRIAEIEYRLADGLLRYAGELRHYHTLRVDPHRIEEQGGTEAIVDERLKRVLIDLAEVDDLEAMFRTFETSHPQYRKLQRATERYRRFVDAGGWEQVPSFTVRSGERSPHAEALRDRLEAEGFDARPTSPEDDFDPHVIDHTLIDGIRDYQRTHQFYVDGVPTDGFWRSLNISAEDRLAQMKLTLRRWHRSHFDGDDDFIMINIPEFYAEVWTDGQQQMRFPVVVGQNRRFCSRESGQWVYPDKTPTMMATMSHIELNPYWYVPPRIVRRTLMPRIEENEDYLEENDYEKIIYEDGGRGIRQRPGDANAMGRVKFNMPNAHSIFLHDTPDRRFFEYGLRAYSHGCIRVSKPVELAEFLFDREEHHDIDLEEVFEEDEPHYVHLEQQLPVFIEYYTVWVDEAGDPHFLIDLYDKDARKLSDDPDSYFDCTPTGGNAPPPDEPLSIAALTADDDSPPSAESDDEPAAADAEPSSPAPPR